MSAPPVTGGPRAVLGALHRAGLAFFAAPDGRLEVRPGSALTAALCEAWRKRHARASKDLARRGRI